ncbi:MAG: GNAT family N-acetyltransferase [Burkholderiaceae bacterium]
MSRTATPPGPVRLRAHRPGDIGWIIEAHGRLYAREYGWDASFEALVAEIGADFLRRFDPASDRCWIAERDGERLGSALIVRKDARTAQLRLVIVEPAARGLGVGKRLVHACIDSARELGYAAMMLWTNDCLHAARGIYEQAGFELVASEAHRSFGHDLVGQNWHLELGSGAQ